MGIRLRSKDNVYELTVAKHLSNATSYLRLTLGYFEERGIYNRFSFIHEISTKNNYLIWWHSSNPEMLPVAPYKTFDCGCNENDTKLCVFNDIQSIREYMNKFDNLPLGEYSIYFSPCNVEKYENKKSVLAKFLDELGNEFDNYVLDAIDDMLLG